MTQPEFKTIEDVISFIDLVHKDLTRFYKKHPEFCSGIFRVEKLTPDLIYELKAHFDSKGNNDTISYKDCKLSYWVHWMYKGMSIKFSTVKVKSIEPDLTKTQFEVIAN